jgi:hypothetical protein
MQPVSPSPLIVYTSSWGSCMFLLHKSAGPCASSLYRIRDLAGTKCKNKFKKHKVRGMIEH